MASFTQLAAYAASVCAVSTMVYFAPSFDTSESDTRAVKSPVEPVAGVSVVDQRFEQRRKAAQLAKKAEIEQVVATQEFSDVAILAPSIQPKIDEVLASVDSTSLIHQEGDVAETERTLNGTIVPAYDLLAALEAGELDAFEAIQTAGAIGFGNAPSFAAITSTLRSGKAASGAKKASASANAASSSNLPGLQTDPFSVFSLGFGSTSVDPNGNVLTPEELLQLIAIGAVDPAMLSQFSPAVANLANLGTPTAAAAVPVPASLPLFAGALVMFGFLRSRKTSN